MTGPGSPGNRFSVSTVRLNPAPLGAVTGKQTFISFLSSVLGESHTFEPHPHLMFALLQLPKGVVWEYTFASFCFNTNILIY